MIRYYGFFGFLFLDIFSMSIIYIKAVKSTFRYIISDNDDSNP